MISVQNVSKLYTLHAHPLNRIVSAFLPKASVGQQFWALRNVSFDVDVGEVVAVVGPNGSGKSTLLQLVSGILESTSGRVLRSGRLSALLELGAGFNAEFTGRENVYLNGEIMGLSRTELDRIFPAIEAFAEIGKFIDRPIKEYSTGMYVRLAFSTAIHVDPQILIVDEALSVGDALFAARCIQKFEELRRRKTTVLLVSHDLGLIKRLADRALFLLNGEIVLDGAPKDVVDRYVGFVLDRGNRPQPVTAPLPEQGAFRHGDGASRIVGVEFLGHDGVPTASAQWGDHLSIVLKVEFLKSCDAPVLGILIRNRVGVDIFGTNTRVEGYRIPACAAGDVLEVSFHLQCLFSKQEYTVTAAVQHQDGLSQDWVNDVLAFTVVDTREVAGVLNLDAKISHTHRPRIPAPPLA